MTVLRIPRRGVRSNSRGRIEINRANPLTVGLLEFTLATPHGLISSSTGAASVNIGATPLTAFAGSPGVGRRSNAISSASADHVSIDLRETSRASPITIYCRGMLGGSVAGGSAAGFSSCRSVYGIAFSSGSSVGFAIASAAASGAIAVGGSLGVSTATGNVVVGNNVVFDAFGASSGGSAAVYSLDVVGVGSAAVSASFNPSPATFKPGIAATGINLSTSTPGDKILFYGAVWNRLLSAEEKQRVAENPLGLIKFAPWELDAPTVAGGSSPVTIACTVGAASAQGIAAVVASPVTIVCGVGNAVASGVACVVASPITIGCVVGSASAAGVPAVVSSPVTIACEVGAAGASGVECVVSSAVSIACAVGSAVGEGIAAAIASPVTIECAVGTATAEGAAAQIVSPVTIACTVGDAVAAGIPAALPESSTVACTVGTAAAAGIACAVASPVTVSCTVGDASATGIPASISVSTVIACAAGNAAGQGVPCNIAASTIIACTPGNADAEGISCAVSTIVTIACETGNAVAFGISASVQSAQAETIACTVGDAVASGITAAIRRGTLTLSPADIDAIADTVAASLIAQGYTSTLAALLTDLAKVHGLIAGLPLVVTPTSRSAGGLVQSIGESGDTVTVERTA